MSETLSVFSPNSDIRSLIHKIIHCQDFVSGQHRLVMKLNVVFLCLEYIFRCPKLNFETDNTMIR